MTFENKQLSLYHAHKVCPEILVYFFTIKYKNSHSLNGNTNGNENLNQGKISNRYEKLHLILIIFLVFMSTKLPTFLIINSLHVRFESNQANTVVLIMPTRFHRQSAKVDLEL